jgi:hypothetical protein
MKNRDTERGIGLYNSYFKNGVRITPNVLVKGDKASVVYKGLLMDSGADTVYMHVGYGDHWENTQDIPMKRTEEGFETTLPITKDLPLKMAFRDNADHWDNNSSRDYTFEVQSRL